MMDEAIQAARWLPLLPVLVPLASSWATEQEFNAQATGQGLTPEQWSNALDVGVTDCGQV